MVIKQQDSLKIFAPATVANVNCGFDALGFALEGIGDEMVFRKTTQLGIQITAITGATLPMNAKDNVAGIAANAMLKGIDADFGIAMEIHKKIRPSSGIGSSAASAAGAVFGINQFLENSLDHTSLTQYAMEGEAFASGNNHADNVAPCLYGGITLITSYTPLHIVSLPTPDQVYVGILHPHIKIATKEARAILPEKIPLTAAIKQAQYLSGFVTALYQNDKTLFERSINDALVTPYRKQLIPHFDVIQTIARSNECFAFGISGSGPSLFAFAHQKEHITQYLNAAQSFFTSKNLKVDAYSSKINSKGCYIL